MACAGALPGLSLVFVESGGDNLAATFSPDLADRHIYVIDVAAGDKIPRKGGLGLGQADLLVINKIDLAPYVGAALDVMARDAAVARDGRPTVFTNMQDGTGLSSVVDHLWGWLAAADVAPADRPSGLIPAGAVEGGLPRWSAGAAPVAL